MERTELDLSPELSLDTYDLIEHMHRHIDFSLETFGPGGRVEGILEHIEEEMEEVRETPEEIEEWIDLVMLALDGAQRQGYSPVQIATALYQKQKKNEERDWPDWREMRQDEAIGHNEEDEEGEWPDRGRFQKKYVPYGVRINEDTVEEIDDYEDCHVSYVPHKHVRNGKQVAYEIVVNVKTNGGELQASYGDWVFEDSQGRHYPVEHREAKRIYTPVNDQ
jgi:hypothetical protein